MVNNTYEVVYTVEFKATITLGPGDLLDDAITDIDIPENNQCKYVDQTFEILLVTQNEHRVVNTDGIYGMADDGDIA